MGPETEILMDFKPAHFQQWVLGTFYGWLIGFIAVIAFALAFETFQQGDQQSFVGLGIGLGVGYMQQRFLRRHTSIGLSWMWANIVGLGLGFFVFEHGDKVMESFPRFTLQGSIILGGLLTGVLQFLVLRKAEIGGKWWVLFCWISWVLTGLMAILAENLPIWFERGTVVNFLSAFALVFGTGIVLAIASGYGIRRVLKGR